MHNTPSRRERRESRFFYLAEQGKMQCNDFSLYKGEERNLRNIHGFDVERYGSDSKKQLPSSISWEHAFKNGIPLIVFDYCIGVIETFPTSQVQNWAQELYVIAARANHEKGLKDGQKRIQEAQKNNE